MKTIIIIFIILFIIILFNIFVYLLWKKINKLENIIIDLFTKRNNQIISISWITKTTIVKHDEIFESFFKLKRQDYWNSSYNEGFENKLNLYKKIHYEINFIIKVCEKHNNIINNPTYIYFKESILEKSSRIWKKIELYNNIKKKYDFLSKISKLTIIWIFIN